MISRVTEMYQQKFRSVWLRSEASEVCRDPGPNCRRNPKVALVVKVLKTMGVSIRLSPDLTTGGAYCVLTSDQNIGLCGSKHEEPGGDRGLRVDEAARAGSFGSGNGGTRKRRIVSGQILVGGGGGEEVVEPLGGHCRAMHPVLG